jgi:hypothetical protein
MFSVLHDLFLAESLHQKEELIRSTMDEKRRLVADLLHIPVEDYDHIAEVSLE